MMMSPMTLAIAVGFPQFHMIGAWSLGNLMNRRTALRRLTIDPMMSSFPSITVARNLPEATGADLAQTGTITTLIPIVRIKETLVSVEKILSQQNDLISQRDSVEQILKRLQAEIPFSEQDFKRIFDQYSDPVSYKQKFLDQNAFLVYYTQGFDGPGRPSIESNTPEKQTLQFGARNEAWVAWESFVAELQFATKSPAESSSQELTGLLESARKAIDSYLALAPSDDVEKATQQARISL